MNSFLTGLIAGYGIAIPVGAIAILILETGIRGGFKSSFMAGAGAATADLVYAAIAATLGGFAAVALARFVLPLQLASGLVLLGLGGWGLWQLRVRRSSQSTPTYTPATAKIYLQFLGLTLLNPMTVVYFAALILGGATGSDSTVAAKILFIAGAGIASLSWQTFLAGGASLLHKRLSSGAQTILSLTGNLVICALALNILARTIATIARPI